MRLAFLLTLIAASAWADHRGRFERFCQRTAQGRTHRGFLCDDGPAFSAFTSSGTGTFGACSTTPPTGAKGETLTFARASGATCSPLGAAATGITTGSLVELTTNQPRVEAGGDGNMALRIEPTRTNSLLRFIELSNIAWSDLGTPTLLAGQPSPWSGTYATGGVTVTDDDPAAYEGRQQNVTVIAGQPYWMHCYVRAGTATSARITVDGAAQTISGLSGSTWAIVEVGDASASSASIVVQVMVGDSVAVTGSVTFGGCQVEQGTYRTSMIPTTSSAVTRAVEDTAVFTVAAGLWATTGSAAFTSTALGSGSIGSQLSFNANARILYSDSGNVLTFDGTNNPSTSGGFVAGAAKRYWSSWSTPGGWVVRNETDGNQATSAFAIGTWTTDTSLELSNVAGIIPGALISNVCMDPIVSRCR